MAAVYLFPLKPTVFQLLLNCFLWNKPFSSHFYVSVIIHCDLNPLPAVPSPMQNSPAAPRMVCRTFSMKCKKKSPMCNICLPMQNNCFVVQNIYRAEKNIFTALQKFALLCPVAQIASRLFELTTRASRKSAMITSPCVVGAILCKISRYSNIQTSRSILMFELPNPPSLNVGWHEWPHKSSWTHLKSISEQRSKDSYPPFDFFRAVLIIRLWRTHNKNLPNWIMPMSDEQGNDLLSRTKSQQKLVHLDLSKWQTTAKNNWSRFADERSPLLISFSVCQLLWFFALFFTFQIFLGTAESLVLLKSGDKVSGRPQS